ncbi:MAG: helix-turn-helix transcriptional regulator [Gammaproteobacteria bacterium]|nr:helix-turn-helix transcriptional regulator [Gammaproteobacteria bacterium]
MSRLNHNLRWYEKLLNARVSAKITQRGLADQLGVPQGHISRIERGLIDPRISTVTEMAYALGLTPMLIPRRAQAAVLAVLRNFERTDETDNGLSAVEILVADDRIDSE